MSDAIVTKECTRCGYIKPATEFFTVKRNKDGLQSHCKECQRAYIRDHYERNKQYYKDKSLGHHRPIADLIYTLRCGACTDCGRHYHPIVMEFDHRNPSEKSYNIAEMRRHSPETALAELAKCDVVCSNCHKLRTHQRYFLGKSNKASLSAVEIATPDVSPRTDAPHYRPKMTFLRPLSQKQIDQKAVPYKGVKFTAKNKRNPYTAQIRVDGKLVFLGDFSRAEDAARAFDRAAVELRGDPCFHNFPEEHISHNLKDD